MNPRLELTQPYPFEKLAALLDSAGATSTLPSIRLSIGEPQHATPECVREALVGHLEGLAIYPTTSG
ncbi:MAG: succinyldiaminopimelate transaminase, partial [Rhodocyclaceae bacterium]|nr:succinyldiaminopimelate transaminase [Rhodocyclaceae bacterium]